MLIVLRVRPVRLTTMCVVLAVLLATVATPAATAAPRVSASGVTAAQHRALLAALDRVPRGATPRRAAALLFPSRPAARADYLRVTGELDHQARLVSRTMARTTPSVTAGTHPVMALPAAAALLLPALGRCVVAALGGAGMAELLQLVDNRRWASAESRVHGAVGGCITAVAPAPVRVLLHKLKRPLVSAILTLLIRWYR